MISLLPWLLILIILGMIGFFMTQQYRDMQHALREMDLRLQEEALRVQDVEAGLQEMTELMADRWAEMSDPVPDMTRTHTHAKGAPSLWKLQNIPEEDDAGDSDIETLPVEEAVDELFSKLEDHVAGATGGLEM